MAVVAGYERALQDVARARDEYRLQFERASAEVAKSELRIESLSISLAKSKHSLHPLSRRAQLLQEELDRIKASRSWQLTLPLRTGLNWLRRVHGIGQRMIRLSLAFVRETRTGGFRHSFRRVRLFLSGSTIALPGVAKTTRPNGLPDAGSASQRLVQRVLLVAELGLQQCLRYRVLQKRQLIQSLGIECSVVNWTDVVATRSLLQTHTIAIFYRVPGWPEQLETLRIAKSLGVVTVWEVDDLIFDLQAYKTNSNLNDLDKATRDGILKGVPVYRAMMLACDECIASTPTLAAEMRKAGVRHTHVMRNALDAEIIRMADRIRQLPRRTDGVIRIVYGSGSRSHDSDFKVAAEGVLRVLKARYYVRLMVIGTLNIPPEYDSVKGQVERLPLTDYETYMESLARADINIAPLEASVFNDAKSNIKYLESAVLGIPSVCSPTEEYLYTVEHEKNGFLATTPEEWEEQILRLVDDRALRSRVGEAARQHALAHFTPEAIAAESVAPFLSSHQALMPSGLRVLGVNIFFEPRSFGGATIVAEQIARRLNEIGGVSYAMFTSTPTHEVHPYKIIRYESSHCEVFAMGLPPEADPVLDFDNPYPVEEFRNVLRAWRPDVVHLHSIQGLGVQLIDVCEQEGIPFVVTLHDAWWLCARQFMVTGEGRYCNQRSISLDVCSRCVRDASMLPYRASRLREALSKAALLLAPSAFSRDLYVANGFDSNKVVVNKNGVASPGSALKRTPPSQRKLRFGFVGGEGVMKGGEMLKKAFRSLPYTNYELWVVDNALNLGWQSIHPEQWQVPGETKIVPAYTQATIDEFFGSIDVLLFPSRCKESFGLAAREALVRDVWLISTDAGGVVEDIVEGENGAIVPFDDDGTALAREIRKLLEDPSRLDGFRNPHARSICLFEQQARELRDLFGQVALRRNSRPMRFMSEVEFHERLMKQM